MTLRIADEFASYRALSFDCYGTLIDWESGIAGALRPWASRHGLEVSREQLLAAFSATETVVQSEQPTARYPDILAEVLRRIGAQLGVGVSATEAATFGASAGDWPAFTDSSNALRRLQSRFMLIVLSNVDRRSFASSSRRLGVDFDRVITAEDVGSYKPAPRNFEALLEHLTDLEVQPDQLLHVAESLYHDHAPAHAVGLRSVWIHRRHALDGFGATPPPQHDVEPDWRFESMAAFADAAGV
ncbi:MAG: haloacid dehalogenase type II [Actinobacteria bacterium]|nr:haloacid dehalogenase type II [Actinomycetota bacterium]